MQVSRLSLLLPALACVCANSAEASDLLYTFGDVATNGDDFGRAVADAGDVDNDGFPDVMVGAPFDDVNGNASGSVYVYSGRTGALIWTQTGEYAGDHFGWALDGVGDIDGDGHSEVIVGAPGWDNNGTWGSSSGRVYILRGSTGGAMFTVATDQAGAQLGTVVRGLGDIDGDGVGDFAFGAPYRDWAGMTNNGYMGVRSGQGFQSLFSLGGTENGAFFGYSLDVVRATGAQATSRLIVGAPGVDGAGTDRGLVTLMDGFGNTVSSFAGITNTEWLGAAVPGIGDANNDGYADYAFSAPYRDVLGSGTDAGSVIVYSGFSTSLLFAQSGNSPGVNYGLSLSGCGDYTGDGHDDVLIGIPSDTSAVSGNGAVQVLSGTGSGNGILWFGNSDGHWGRSVSGAGDLNGDGRGDLVFGANDAANGHGRAFVYLAGNSGLGEYCTGKVNSQGCLPDIEVSGVPSLSIANNLHITASNVLNNQFGMLFWGEAINFQPFEGGTLCVLPPLRRTLVQQSNGSVGPSDCSGTYDFHFSHAYMASEGTLPGTHVHAQYWSRDPFSPGPGLTNGVFFYVLH